MSITEVLCVLALNVANSSAIASMNDIPNIVE